MPWPAPRPRLICLLLALGCSGEEPVLPGVPAAPILEEVPSASERATAVMSGGAAPSVEAERPYRLPDGVRIDVRYLGGRRYSEVRDLVADQLGPLQDTEEAAGHNERELRFARGDLRLDGDEIVMIRVPFPSPARRTEALAELGFPAPSGSYITLHREYRLNHEWGFRRIRLMREDRHSERVTLVEAWHRVPGESRAGR